MKRKVAGVLAAAMAAGMLAGCGSSAKPADTTAAKAEDTKAAEGSTEAAADNGDKITIEFWHCMGSSNGELIQQITDSFNESQDKIFVKAVHQGSYTDAGTKMQAALAAGEAPVLAQMEIGMLGIFADADQLVDLQKFVDEENYDMSDFMSGLLDASYYNGALVALPHSRSVPVLYYNKDLFDKAGVEYPSNDLTMEDYDALARKMTSGSGDTKVYGCHYHTWRSAASLFSILDGKNTIIDGKYDFMKPTYDMVIAQQKDGICMDYGYLKTSSLHYSAAFENQQCAMVNMGSWFISTLEAYMKDAETKFNWGIVKYPHPAGAEAGSTLGTVTSLAINADSPKAEAAADFINWCVSEEGAQAIAKTGTFPACGSAATAEIIKSTEGFPEDSNSVDALTTSNVYLEMPYTQYASDIETILNAEHDAIMTMSETVDEGIQNMNDQVPAVLG